MFCLAVVLNCFSQDYSYINYDTRDGLAGSVVYDAIQDKEGFMWFATENGLSRFDGKTFKTFTTKDGLPDNEILKLFVDSRGRVWIMPFRPSVCYYFKGKIYNKENDSLLSKLSFRNYVSEIAEDKSGNLFVAEDREWHIIFKNGSVRTVDKINDLPIYVVALGINRFHQAELFVVVQVSTVSRSCRLVYPIENKIESVKEDIQYAPDVSRTLITPDYVLIPGEMGSVLSFYKDSDEIIPVGIPSNTVSVNQITGGRIILNTTSGVRFIDTQTKTISEPMFTDFSVTSSYQDKEDNFWLTTAGSGVTMVPSFQFKNFYFSTNKKLGEITAVYQFGDTVYAAGWGNRVWKVNINNFKTGQSFADFHNGKIVSIVRLNNKLVLTSSFYGRHSNIANNTFSRRLSIKSITMGKSGVLRATHANALLSRPSGAEDIIWEGRTTCAIERDSGFYLGTLTGLVFKSYAGQTVDLGKTFPELASRIVNLGVSGNGILWVTTKGDGIIGYFHGKPLYHFTQADGLTSDNCNSLFIDRNVVWLGTEKGLNRIDISRKKMITRFSMSDGLPSNTINAITASGNKVFVGTPKGLTYFEVDKISQTSTCDFQLTGIYVGNKYWSYDSTNFSLPHERNDVSFEFSGISFKSAGEINYKYRLLGLQPEWRTTTQNQLSFPSLSSGKYTLELVAINKYGVQSKMKQVSFVIEKLLWEKTWFRIGIALLLAAVVWSFISVRVKGIRRKEKDKTAINKRINELEQTALRSQMNPHFIFNCLNSIQQYVAERDITGANNFITDFSRLIRMTLDLSTHPLISLADEVEYISTYLRVEKTRLEGVFDYSVHIDKSLDPSEVQMPPLLLQPYLENSIRHGIRYRTEGDGLIQINITKKNDGVLIQIQDNGIGRQASKKYKSEHHIQYQSRGMTINEDRIKILNKTAERRIELTVTDLYNSKEEAEGTRVDVYLPS
jgi:ligand-binding sensor domain-containing protein